MRRVLLCEPGYTNRFLGGIESDQKGCLAEYTAASEDLLGRFDEVYYRECLAGKIEIGAGWRKHAEPKVWCLVSGKRTGSTLVIDYLQKCHPGGEVLALSEIFNLDNAFMESFDVTNEKGVLHPYRDALRRDTGDHEAYLGQFLELAASRFVTTVVVFKYTVDFLYDYGYFMARHDALFRLFEEKGIRIVYLNRNELESYVSYKLALVYGFSNTEYPGIPPGIFDLTELHAMCSNKHAFEARLLGETRIEGYLDYAMISGDHQENLAWIHGVFGLETEGCLSGGINKKQNTLPHEAILDRNNWR